MKKVAILQSNYIPWKGYFDLIAAVDEFILYDDMQYTRRDWRNRNQIKTPQGLQWLTIPVVVKGRYHQSIRETAIQGEEWAAQHWRALIQNYRRAAHFDAVAPWLESLYASSPRALLSDVNRVWIEAICRYLGIATKISSSSDFRLVEGKSERLADLCAQAGADVYVSGPAARDYLDESAFTTHRIDVSWFDYNGYPEYPQPWGPFCHSVSVLDLILNCGSDATRYMRYAGK